MRSGGVCGPWATVRMPAAPGARWRRAAFALVQHRAFDPIVMACIVANVLFMVGSFKLRTWFQSA